MKLLSGITAEFKTKNYSPITIINRGNSLIFSEDFKNWIFIPRGEWAKLVDEINLMLRTPVPVEGE